MDLYQTKVQPFGLRRLNLRKNGYMLTFIKKLIPQAIKNTYHLKLAILANLWYGFPSNELKVIGVTGTNGKTTTVQMITRILEEAGFKTAAISTINFKIDRKEWINTTKFTTLSSFAIQKFIREAVRSGCEYLVLETSSHALDQYRTWGINYKIAVITNVTREHLDYHRTMDEYRRAKLKLFKKAQVAIVNLDMENTSYFLQFNNKDKFGYTTQNQNAKIKNQNDPNKSLRDNGASNAKCKIISAENIEPGIDYSKFIINNQQFMISLPGLFNIENALAAICVGLSEDINLEKISQALGKLKGVPGRLEYVSNNKELNIIIDYAVTPDSLEKLYKLIKQIKEVRPPSTLTAKGGQTSKDSRVIAVFGACGERDRGKRPIMGEIVSQYADYIIVTNEDPYHENPQKIIDEVFAGAIPHPPTPSPDGRGWPVRPGEGKTEGINSFRILDRRKAIKKALQIAKPGDFVIITGKGAEETMAVRDKRIPWNDKKVIQEVLQELK